jgi:mutual gliding-motility protein MglA
MRVAILGIAVVLVGGLFASAARAAYIDKHRKVLTVKIVYYGSPASLTAGSDSLAYIDAKTRTSKKAKRVERGKSDGTVHFDFLPLSLGKTRGWTTLVHLFAVPTERSVTAGRLLLLKGADGIVFIADADPASARSNADSLAELREHLKSLGDDYVKLPIVVQVVGTGRPGAMSVDAIEKSLGVAGVSVHAASPKTGQGVFDTVKAITKLALIEAKKANAALPTPAEGPAPN